MHSLARGGIEAWGINRLQATTNLDFCRHDRNSCSMKTLAPEALERSGRTSFLLLRLGRSGRDRVGQRSESERRSMRDTEMDRSAEAIN